MPNSFVTAQAGNIAQVALATLNRLSVLPALVHRDLQNDFRAGQGAVVNIRKPATLAARQYSATLRNAGTPIVLDDVTETTVPVTIDRHTYSAVGIPDEDATLNLQSFASQVLVPQMQAVSEDVETALAARFTGLPATNDISVSQAATTDQALKLIDARTFLSKNKVPLAGRHLVMGADFAAFMLRSERVSRVDVSGTDTALRQAQFTPLFGFTPYESLAVPNDQAFAFSSDAIALATVTPVAPRGAVASADVSANGVTMRWLSDYDPAFLRDRSLVSIMHGSAVLDPNRIVRLKLVA